MCSRCLCARGPEVLGVPMWRRRRSRFAKKQSGKIVVGITRELLQMDDMRVEVGVKEISKQKLVRSTWAGDIDKMEDDKLAKRADA